MEGFWPAFAALVVVAGPWKAAIVFAETTVDMDMADRRRTGWLTVAIAAVVGLAVLVFGLALIELFHIEPAGFLIGAGLIVVVFAVRMVILPPDDHGAESGAASSPMRLAVYPLAIPMLLTPPAVASLTAIGIDAGVSDEKLVGAAVAFLVVMVINLVVFLILSQYEHLVPTPAWEVAGRLLGIFLVAFGVTIIIEGMKLVGS